MPAMGNVSCPSLAVCKLTLQLLLLDCVKSIHAAEESKCKDCAALRFADWNDQGAQSGERKQEEEQWERENLQQTPR